jgi:hypothetical protein
VGSSRSWDSAWSALGRDRCKSRKSNDSENLAKADV